MTFMAAMSLVLIGLTTWGVLSRQFSSCLRTRKNSSTKSFASLLVGVMTRVDVSSGKGEMVMRRYILPPSELEKIIEHVFSAIPKEACGLLLARDSARNSILSFIGLPSSGNSEYSFRIKDISICQIANSLRGSKTRICGCVHSHIRGRAKPSLVDCESSKGQCLIWMIYSVRYQELNLFEWCETGFRKIHLRIGGVAQKQL
jgi:proteasome lid subunit RPN8/RPN11